MLGESALGEFALGEVGSVAVSGSPYTLTAEGGTYTKTGSDTGIRAARYIAALTTSYLSSGQDSGLRAARNLSAEAASYSYTGQDAILIYTSVGGYTILAEGGSYSLSGMDATLRAGRVVISESASYSLSGFNAGLLTTRQLEALSGTYVETGVDAGLAAGYKVSALVGGYNQSGTNAGLIWSGAPASTGGPDIKTAGRSIMALKSESALPVQLTVSDSTGGVSGLAVTMQVRDSTGTGSYLDFNDMTFKTSGWTTKDLSLTDLVNGVYAGTLNIAAITNLPDGSYLTLEYTVSGTVSGVVTDLIIFDPAVYAPQILTVGKFIGLS